MRRFFTILAPAAAAAVLVLTGCPAKPKPGECKSSAECANQEGYGKVCVQGHCQECAADTDCAAGFACKDDKCVPRPECQSDSDCPAGKTCQADKCVVGLRPGDCNTDSDCPSGQGCQAGKCAAKVASSDAGAECGDPAAFTIQFGFDQSVLTQDSLGTLQKLADCLKKATAKKLVVAGNCDERGTTQYNIALGERRAQAAKKYLDDLGTAAKIETVSYGKERPVCSASTEDCWAKNRRDDFKIDR